MKPPVAPWSQDQAVRAYSVDRWSNGYFRVGDDGTLHVCSEVDGHPVSVSLAEIAKGLETRGTKMPILLRIENLLEQRVAELAGSFADAIERYDYPNVYRGVYPVKVNQQAQVVKVLAEAGKPWHHGLEVGSKAELIIGLSLIESNEALIICNGYKDEEFLRLALSGLKLGMNVMLVIESPRELETIIAVSEELDVRPQLGIRIKNGTVVSGHWSATSGENSVFGLTAMQLMVALDRLRDANMLDCFQLLHCHLGSQIPDIRDIRAGVTEACRFYTELVAEGAGLRYLDLGGGLAVDYNGNRSVGEHSCNYGLREYCEVVVETIGICCDRADVTAPIIVTESGRATVAYSSILLFNVVDITTHAAASLPQALPDNPDSATVGLWELKDEIVADLSTLQKCYHDVGFYRDEVRERFHAGVISLRERALADGLGRQRLREIRELLSEVDGLTPELEQLAVQQVDIYHCNFSLFQSLPDAWAIDQLFPMMPIHRLDEAPQRNGILADITCDSDGKIDRFFGPRGVQASLPLHTLKDDEEYWLGVFLVGAYQETLGDLHNLFGDTHVVAVRLTADGTFALSGEVEGDSIADVLSYVEYDPRELTERFREKLEKAVRSGKLRVAQRKELMTRFNDSINGYTYHED
ncbi:biosynthetic arginine decarboxylase [Gammaproteobacteria bacterium]|nr:biosynthetic arginine decarboxylase [Gammaproteobacteria bacterium]